MKSGYPNVHRAIITKHNSIYYQILETEIEIITIFDNRQDPNNLVL